MIVGLIGNIGVGKDTVAKILVETRGYEQLSFAAKLYEEVSEAFSVSTTFLSLRESKEIPTRLLQLSNCRNFEFAALMQSVHGVPKDLYLSPRQVLQWWGAEYRRNKDPDYWITPIKDIIDIFPDTDFVISDVRFANEVALIRSYRYNMLIRVDRPNAPNVPSTGHASEGLANIITPNYTLVNEENNFYALEEQLDDFI